MKKLLFVMMLLSGAVVCRGQQQPSGKMALDDLSAFRSQAGNWMIVGDVTMDPNIDIHEKPTPPKPVETGSKKKKKSSDTPVTTTPPRQAVTYTSGKGILLNMNDDQKKDQLVSAFEHGDIELELEVMLPKGSNSGIYLQGRYEVQLLDSWGVKNPKFSDIGGIYRNWETTPGKVYMGKAPLSNPAKAPGLWQTLKISFRAPRFDAQGNKIANAKFTSVELNGVQIHRNLEVPLPTGGPIENNEKAKGPLMIQGDHGPVAFRNIRYRLMKEADVKLGDVAFRTWYGKFNAESEYKNLKPAASGTLKELTNEMLDREDGYAVAYTGTVTVPEDAEYEFIARFTGGGSVKINNEEIVSFQRGDGWIDQSKKLTLKAGTYPIEIQNFKDVGWMPPLMGLFVRSETMYEKSLHAFNSFPPYNDTTSPILISAGEGPRLLRAFIDFKGDGRRRLTHTIGVGEASGMNYVYDLGTGNLVCTWRGNFVDATPMWHDRGDGSFRPLGAAQYLFTGQPMASIQVTTEAFPDVATDYRSKGYVIDEKTSRPIFKYSYRGIEVTDKIYPDDDNRIFTREVTLASPAAAGLYFKIAEGKSIQKMPDGSYAIDDKQYYIRLADGSKPYLREGNDTTELMLSLEGATTVKYSIVW